MIRKILAAALTAALTLSAFAVLTLAPSFADEESDLEAVRKEISTTQAKYNEGRKRESALNSQIKDLETKIKAAEAEVAGIQGDINKTRDAIAEVERELAEAEAELDDQNADMNARLRAMYMNREMGMIEIVLNSSDISEFMAMTDMVKKIYRSDVAMIEDMEDEYAQIDAQRLRLVELKQRLVAQQTVASDRQNRIEADKNAVALAKIEVSEENKKLSKMLDELNAEANKITAEILKKQGTQAYMGGSMLWPVPGYSKISSEFGNRMHPTLKVQKMHTGMDIPAPTGTPVQAANGGIVIKSGWNNSYGNLVMIDHGGKIVTLYAHNSKLAVKEGDVVGAGQVIAYVGSTGNSTGPHCHFEVRVNGDYQNPRNWVKP